LRTQTPHHPRVCQLKSGNKIRSHSRLVALVTRVHIRAAAAAAAALPAKRSLKQRLSTACDQNVVVCRISWPRNVRLQEMKLAKMTRTCTIYHSFPNSKRGNHHRLCRLRPRKRNPRKRLNLLNQTQKKLIRFLAMPTMAAKTTAAQAIAMPVAPKAAARSSVTTSTTRGECFLVAHSAFFTASDENARFAVPTADEMRHLRETEQLYSSNVLRLQLDALIEDSTILNKSTGALQQWMRDLKAHVTRSLPQAQQPVHCGVAGSFLSQTCLRGRLNADIVVVMPTPPLPSQATGKPASGSTASSGLHMSGALFPHIAQYTLLLAEAVRGFCAAEPTASRGHKHVCCVLCTPHGPNLSGMERSFSVRMHVIADASSLPHKRFSPSHNNFRPSVPATPYPPTPHYNSSLMEVCFTPLHPIPPTRSRHLTQCLQDITMEALHAVVTSSLSNCPAAAQAAVLLKIFLMQRSSLNTPYSFHPLAPALLVADTLASGSASRALSNYQIFRVVLERLAAAEAAGASVPWRLASSVTAPPPFDTPPGDAFGDDKWAAAFPVCIIDPTGRVNLARRVTAGAWTDLRAHAAQLLAELSSSPETAFESAFIRRCNLADRFDDIVRVVLTNFVPDEPGSSADLACGMLLSHKLQKMLPTRLVSCVPIAAQGAFSDGGVGAAWDGVVTLGLQLNDQGAWALLERGPHSHETAQVAEFRATWGDVVETRQFRDGSVMECVPWSERACDRWRVPAVAVAAAVHRACAGVQDVRVVASAFEEEALGLASSKSREKAMRDRDGLRESIRDLSSILADIPSERVPLRITAVHNVDPAFRSTTLHHPSASPFCGADKMFGQALSRVVTPLHIVCSLEGSSQWPTDINALRALKTAILCTLADAVRDQVHSAQPHRAHVDICHKGYAFRLVLHVEIERDIAAAAASSTSALTRGIDVVYSIAPAHSAAVTSASLRMPALAGCIKLAQCWLAAECMGGSIPHPALELLCVVACAGGCRRPLTPWAAFMRWLDVMAHTDFATHVQAVDPAQTWPVSSSSSTVSMTSPALVAAAAAALKNLELCALVLPTPYDAAGTAFTSDHPSRAELKRVQMLAAAAAASAATAGHGIMRPSDTSAVDIVVEFSPTWKLLPPLKATPFPNGVQPPLLDFSPPTLVEQSLRSSVGSGGGIVTKGVAASGHACERTCCVGLICHLSYAHE
jgi:U3 small nucleolar RNA-associated protein 22